MGATRDPDPTDLDGMFVVTPGVPRDGPLSGSRPCARPAARHRREGRVERGIGDESLISRSPTRGRLDALPSGSGSMSTSHFPRGDRRTRDSSRRTGAAKCLSSPSPSIAACHRSGSRRRAQRPVVRRGRRRIPLRLRDGRHDGADGRSAPRGGRDRVSVAHDDARRGPDEHGGGHGRGRVTDLNAEVRLHLGHRAGLTVVAWPRSCCSRGTCGSTTTQP